MTKAMAEAGADAVMVVTPSYFKSLMNNQALEQHYMKVNKVDKIGNNQKPRSQQTPRSH